jgi:hypothetical protein
MQRGFCAEEWLFLGLAVNVAAELYFVVLWVFEKGVDTKTEIP